MAILRGEITVSSGEVTYSGKWAFSKEAFAAKDTGKFELKAKAPEDFPGQAELAFQGFFVLKKGEGEEMKRVKIPEQDVKVSFAKEESKSSYTCTGTGKNKFGEFDLTGAFDPVSRKMQAAKVYREEDEDFEGGDAGNSSGDDSGDDDDGEGFVEDDVAEELAALKADQIEHGLVLAEGGDEAGTAAGSTDKSKRRRQPSGGGGGGASPTAPPAKAGKRLVKRSRVEEGEAAEEAAPPAATAATATQDPWEAAKLEQAQARLEQMVALNDSLGICFSLDALASGGQITVPLLQDTGIGKEVRALKKHADPEVSRKAGDLVAQWKEAVKPKPVPAPAEEPPTATATNEPELKAAAPILAAAAEPSAPDPK